MRFTNLYSNVWLLSNYDNQNITNDDMLNIMNKIKTTHNISKIINFDNEFSFWQSKGATIEFNNTINTQIILDNQKRCLLLYQKISKILINSFISNKEILLISVNKLECLLGFLIYFICKNGDISLEKAITTLDSKLGCLHGYILDENIKKIVIKECYSR